MTPNEQIVRSGYEIAERQDAEGFIATFTPDGEFNNEALGVIYRGRDVAVPLMIFATAFPDMHRELHKVYVDGNTVIVELSLQGTHQGPLELPMGVIPPTGKRMNAPCCDVFRLKDGKIQLFNCYPSATVMLAQLGVLGNIQASLRAS
jgi:ketosteroid isomerase-like protein